MLASGAYQRLMRAVASCSEGQIRAPFTFSQVFTVGVEHANQVGEGAHLKRRRVRGVPVPADVQEPATIGGLHVDLRLEPQVKQSGPSLPQEPFKPTR